MLNKYFIVLIAENTIILHWKKVKTGILDYTSLDENELKLSTCYLKPTLIFSDAEI